MPDHRYNPQTDEIGSEYFTFSLTRQFKHGYEDEYWLCIYFEMSPYFAKYCLQLKDGRMGLLILLTKILFGQKVQDKRNRFISLIKSFMSIRKYSILKMLYLFPNLFI